MLTASNLTINNYPAYPLWKDIYFSTEGTALSALNTVDVEVSAPGIGTVFTGRASKRPGDAYIKVRLNDLFVGILRQQADTSVEAYGTMVDGPAVLNIPFRLFYGIGAYFNIQATDTDGNNPVSEWGVIFGDVTYNHRADFDFDADSGVANGLFPQASRNALVSRAADPRQYILISTLKGNRLVISKIRPSQSSRPVFNYDIDNRNEEPRLFAIKASELADYTPNLENKFAYRIQWYDANDEPIDLFSSQYPEGGTGPFDSKPSIQLVKSCARYCLYYLNAKGGWDWLLIQGKAVESESYSRSSMTKRASTDLLFEKIQHRETEVVGETVTRHLELHTHWLTDDEASRMWHLTGSPDVYVHDLETGIIHPAVLTDSSHTYKTYRNEGNKLIQYTINLDYAVEAQRR